MIKSMHMRSGGALVAVLMLGSCGGGTGTGGGGGAVVAMEMGEWEWTMRVANVRMDNLPPEMRGEMGRMRTNESRTERSCVSATADVVRIQNLRFTVPMPGRPEAGCRIAELSMESGRIRGEMSCEGVPMGPFRDARTMSMSGEMNGTYSARSLDMTARGEVRIGANNGSAEMRIGGRRIGACPPPRPYMPPPAMMPPQVAPAPSPLPPGSGAGNSM